MKTLLIGAGGVGGSIAARLAQAGCELTVVARGEHGRVLAERGVVVRGDGGDENVRLPRVVADAESLHERFELIVLAVKAAQLESACDVLPNVIAPSGVVVPLLNGLTSEDVVAHYVGAQRTLAAVAYMSAGIVTPGTLYVHGNIQLGLAPYRPGQEEDLTRVESLLQQAGVAVRKQDDYRAMLWQKMVWNAPFNAICALSGRTSGEALERMEPLIRRAMLEVIAVARAEDVPLSDGVVDGMLQLTRSAYPLTEPSMLQDMRRGRETEVAVLQDEVVARGERLGVPTPVLFTLAQLVHGHV